MPNMLNPAGGRFKKSKRTPSPVDHSSQRRTRKSSVAPAHGGMPGMLPSGAALPGARPTATSSMFSQPNPQSGGQPPMTLNSPGGFGGNQQGGVPQSAYNAQDFFQQSAQAYADQLLPSLQRGLGMARSRFAGGAIRSGGAQAAEELAFERLFANPLQGRIAQMSGQALQYSQQQQAHQLDQQRLQEIVRQYNLSRQDQKDANKGSLLGAIIGALGTAGGALIGGPAGAAIGGSIGGKIGGAMDGKAQQQNNPWSIY